MRKYNSDESGSTALGQGGSIYCDGTAVAASTGTIFVAITIVSDAIFNVLTKESGFNCPGIDAASGVGGDAIVNTDEFPAGITIYGRWTNIDVTQGAVIAYLG